MDVAPSSVLRFHLDKIDILSLVDQKSFNFISAFACYKQKCKLAPFNLGHPVGLAVIKIRNINKSLISLVGLHFLAAHLQSTLHNQHFWHHGGKVPAIKLALGAAILTHRTSFLANNVSTAIARHSVDWPVNLLSASWFVSDLTDSELTVSELVCQWLDWQRVDCQWVGLSVTWLTASWLSVSWFVSEMSVCHWRQPETVI